MLWEFQPRSRRAILRVQGHLLRAGDRVDLQRPPRRGHIRYGLRRVEGIPTGEDGRVFALAWLLGAEVHISRDEAESYLAAQPQERVSSLGDSLTWR